MRASVAADDNSTQVSQHGKQILARKYRAPSWVCFRYATSLRRESICVQKPTAP